MTEQAKTALYRVVAELKECRRILDTAMYYSGVQLPDADKEKCREVYDAICGVMDLL